MGHLNNDNASNNATAAAELEIRLIHRMPNCDWRADEKQLGYVYCYELELCVTSYLSDALDM